VTSAIEKLTPVIASPGVTGDARSIDDMHNSDQTVALRRGPRRA
jgi:hypothetical protein